ncbi:DUF4307 domain-containing protein [Aeromicrobium duanguangcaii]|uniref:DUF4307 domain-containing protein n=1 Tax=Aeromicrobium duanguangcaii TaxID=2968086 RepID=A0ABY5KGN7_9ACTN|nr:DUF4307 domain-containing protein [Aeromicrobium duanguangcaii]MCD9153759.1 DUF4307 domain-containing protein [Aeromicrobium duanguangcaii]UUI69163.1 DUF4307 domain-containing protein [Aeromicrobium duanguangcaii]
MTDLDARYGRHRRTTPRWLWPLVAALGITAGIAWAAWASWTNVPPFQARVHSFEVIDDQRTKVDLEIFRDEPVALTCRVFAQAHDKHVVGERNIEVPASSQSPVRIVSEIRTERRAVTAVLDSCEEG